MKNMYRVIEIFGFGLIIISFILLVSERVVDIGKLEPLFQEKELMWWGGLMFYFIGYGLRKNEEKKNNAIQ